MTVAVPAPAGPPDDPTPVSILTGFLGSGKTTLLRHLLGQPGLAETAVIVNEFGEIGLDHALVEGSDEDIILLNSGCLCCTVRGDLVQTLRGLYERRARSEVPAFRRVIIETTGLADPAPILHTLMDDPLLVAWYRLDGVIATVDAATGGATLDRHRESLKQAAVADRIVLTKTDMADAAQSDALRRRLHALNPAAPILESAHGRVDPAAILDAGLYNPQTKHPDVARWLQAEAYGDDGHDHHEHDVNRHGDDIQAFCLTHDEPLDWDRFNAWIETLIALHGADLLRIKGILDVAGMDRPLVIHGVQHLFHPPVMLDRWPRGPRNSRLVFITRGLERETFARSLTAFTAGAPEAMARERL